MQSAACVKEGRPVGQCTEWEVALGGGVISSPAAPRSLTPFCRFLTPFCLCVTLLLTQIQTQIQNSNSSQQIREYLEKSYVESSGRDTIKLAIRALMETVEASSKNIEIAVMEQTGLRWVVCGWLRRVWRAVWVAVARGCAGSWAARACNWVAHRQGHVAVCAGCTILLCYILTALLQSAQVRLLEQVAAGWSGT